MKIQHFLTIILLCLLQIYQLQSSEEKGDFKIAGSKRNAQLLIDLAVQEEEIQTREKEKIKVTTITENVSCYCGKNCDIVTTFTNGTGSRSTSIKVDRRHSFINLRSYYSPGSRVPSFSKYCAVSGITIYPYNNRHILVNDINFESNSYNDSHAQLMVAIKDYHQRNSLKKY